MLQVKKAELFVYLAGKVLVLRHSQITNLQGSESNLEFSVPKMKTVTDAMLRDTTVTILNISTNTLEAKLSFRKTTAISCWMSSRSEKNMEESRQPGTSKPKRA